MQPIFGKSQKLDQMGPDILSCWTNFDGWLNLANDWVYNQQFKGFWFLDEKRGHVINKLELIFMIVSSCINLFHGFNQFYVRNWPGHLMNRFLYCQEQDQGQGQIVLQLDGFDLVEKYFLCQYKPLFLHCVRDLASSSGFQNDAE